MLAIRNDDALFIFHGNVDVHYFLFSGFCSVCLKFINRQECPMFTKKRKKDCVNMTIK